MPFKKPVQKYNASINTVEIGVGDKKVVLGGESAMPLYTFDDAVKNAPKIGIEISDLGYADQVPGISGFYADCATLADMAKKAASVEDASFVCVRFDSADPNGKNASVEDCAAEAKAVADAIDKPIVVAGCKNDEKDTALFAKLAEVLQGKNVLFLACKEANYKGVAASAGLAYNQKIGAESAVDINLAKQLNVLITQMGVAPDSVVMNTGTAAAGYGFEYVVSTLDRVKAAALGQNDTSLQMPIMTPVGSETWIVKEAVATEEDIPQWGDQEKRGISMEVATAAAVLASGTNAVILRHPASIATVAKLLKELI